MIKDVVVNEKDEIFVKAKDCGIPFLWLMSDSVPLAYFGKSRKPWVRVTDIISLLKKEAEEVPSKKDEYEFKAKCVEEFLAKAQKSIGQLEE